MLRFNERIVSNKGGCCTRLLAVLVVVLAGYTTPLAIAQDNFEAPNGASGNGGSGVSILDETKRSNGHDVYLFSGEYYTEIEDLRIPGRGFDFSWKRKYRSREGSNTPQGENWDFSYNIYVEASGLDLILHDGNSRQDLYSLQANGCWTADGFFREICQSGNDYVVTFPDMFTWTLAPLDGSVTAGKLLEMRDRNNNTMTFHYDTLGRLYRVRDTLSDSTQAPVISQSLQPPLPASPPHDILKNRYISFEHDTNNTGQIYYKVTNVGAGGVETLGWVGDLFIDNSPDESYFHLVPFSQAVAFSNTWSGIIHVGDCKIIPDATYAVATDSGAGTESTSLLVKTINKPADGKTWGDVVGTNVNNIWTAPQGIVNGNDIVALIQKFQLLSNAIHTTRADLLLNNVTGVVNGTDILAVVIAFQGQPYPANQLGPCTSGCIDCTDNRDREIGISYYNDTNKIKSISDWAGRTVTYQYYADGEPDGSDGDLKSVSYPVVESNSQFTIPAGHEFPIGKTWTYTYSTGSTEAPLNHNLLTISNRPVNRMFCFWAGFIRGESFFPFIAAIWDYFAMVARQRWLASDRVITFRVGSWVSPRCGRVCLVDMTAARLCDADKSRAG